MRSGLSKAYSGTAYVVLALGVVQFFLAGLGVFGASSFDAHVGVGWITHTLTFLVLIFAIAGPRNGRDIGMAGALVVIATIQVTLAQIRGDVPELAALHPVFALLVLGLAAHIGRRYIGSGRDSAGPPAAAA